MVPPSGPIYNLDGQAPLSFEQNKLIVRNQNLLFCTILTFSVTSPSTILEDKMLYCVTVTTKANRCVL
jgi:hypothetical protein